LSESYITTISSARLIRILKKEKTHSPQVLASNR
jgi:hypothetical protein